MRRTRRAYLSGGMQFATRLGGQWRKEIGEWLLLNLRHTVFDPVVESGRFQSALRRRGWKLSGRERRGKDWEKFFHAIVKKDIAAVRSADYVICLWNIGARRGAGTQGELTVARDAGIPVYLVSRTKREHLPGWVQGCIDRHFGGFGDLKMFLKHAYKQKGGGTSS